MSNLYLYECFHCGKILSLTEVLDNAYALGCDISEYIGFKCPFCEEAIVAILYEKQINFGDFDGFPGPAFIQHAVMRTPKLKWDRIGWEWNIEDSGRSRILKKRDMTITNEYEDEEGKFHFEQNGKKWVLEPEQISKDEWQYTPREEKEGEEK